MLPGVGNQASWGGILASVSHPRIVTHKANNLSLLLPPFLREEPKEELAKTVMGLVTRHSDTQPVLGLLGGEVTLTSQEHRTEKGLEGSLGPGASVI